MSTRANIVLTEGNQKLIFYRHSDGYPEGTLPTLNIFLKWLKDGKIRTDLHQSAGWLIVLGAIEYNTIPKFEASEPNKYGYSDVPIETIQEPKDWKVGSIEPTTCIHSDIQFLYTIDIVKKEITYCEV